MGRIAFCVYNLGAPHARGILGAKVKVYLGSGGAFLGKDSAVVETIRLIVERGNQLGLH